MNKPEKLNDDMLSRYISPEKIEKAPEGFTQRTMIRLQSEKLPIYGREKSVRNYRVPVLSALITFGLIIAAILLSSSNEYIFDLSILKSVVNLNLSVVKIDKLFSFTLPELIIYISLGIFTLLLFDKVLNRLFHRGESNS